MPKKSKDEHTHLVVKRKKIVEEKTEVDKLAFPVKCLIAQLSTKTINIKKITLIVADKEELLQQTNNPGMSLEVYISPGLQPH